MMKHNRVSVWIVPALLCTFGDAGAADVEVHVTGLQPGTGNVLAGLYLNQAEFEAEKMTDWRVAPIGEQSETKLVFTNLDAGTYGIAVFQDLNTNEVLDKTSLGVPTEPYGFSNNARNRFRTPDFSEFAFDVGAAPVSLEIQLE